MKRRERINQLSPKKKCYKYQLELPIVSYNAKIYKKNEKSKFSENYFQK